MLRWPGAVSLVNGRVVTPDGIASAIRFSSRVLALDAAPRSGDAVIDLDGSFVLPGLINAHDHLELNHYGLLKCRERYDNASDWIDDLRPALKDNEMIRRGREYPLGDRLLVGVLKNLLAGVTTVAHHNPIYRGLKGRLPLRIVRAFGWAHSFALQQSPVGAHGESGGDIGERYERTPPHLPFIVHAGEGVDERAAAEIPRLERIGCLRANTVIVHGVALDLDVWHRMLDAGAGLVWCPASNHFLFGRTIPVRRLLDDDPRAADRLCLGTDSRVTGSNDLLEELRTAARVEPLSPNELLRMVTTTPAALMRLREAGRLTVGGAADLLVVPAAADEAGATLLAARRADLQLVVVGGSPMVAAPAFGDVFTARGLSTAQVRVDVAERLMNARLARWVRDAALNEPGVRWP